MTGDMVPVDVLGVVGIPNLKDRLTELVRRVRELRLDLNEYICLKYILLLNPGLPYCTVSFSAVSHHLMITVWRIHGQRLRQS